MSNSARTFRLPRGFRTRWWLAGILIGCLLPMGVADGRFEVSTAQLIRICFHSPELIRAESRRRCRLRRLRRIVVTCLRRMQRFTLPRRPFLALSIGHDVLSRRGPPVDVSLRPNMI